MIPVPQENQVPSCLVSSVHLQARQALSQEQVHPAEGKLVDDQGTVVLLLQQPTNILNVDKLQGGQKR